MILGPKYVKAVKLNLWDIWDGNLQEAMERLMFVPIDITAYHEHYQGFEEGRAKFKELLSQLRQKAAESQGTKSPN